MTHPAHQYAANVVDGRISAGRPVVRACRRHLDDLETAASRGYYFDEERANLVLDFSRLLPHFEGSFAGQPFEPLPWQVFVMSNIFGWKREADGLRRYRSAFVEVARKNGKTFLAAVVMYVLLLLDDEPAAQIWCAATETEQSFVTFRPAAAMLEACSWLQKHVESSPKDLSSIDRKPTGRERLFVPATHSFIGLCSKNADTKDGRNPHGIIADEVHAHPSNRLIRVLESGVGMRRQPLTLFTTTAGYLTHGYGAELREAYLRLLDPGSGVSNDRMFGYLAELDEEDDPLAVDIGSTEDVERILPIWQKANPSLGAIVRRENLMAQVAEAQIIGRAREEVLIKQFNRWIASGSSWLKLDQWDRNVGPWAR